MSWPKQQPNGVVFRPRAACYRCFKPAVACVCDVITRVVNQTGVTILQHPRERFHAVGTERIARLGLTNIRVELLAPWSDAGEARRLIPDGAALLYPGPGARDLAGLPQSERPKHLVMIDGTWWQAKKVHDAHTWLHELPQVSLTPSEPSRYRLRREPKATYVATIEAIVQALRILEPQTHGLDGLLQSFAVMIERQAQFQIRPAPFETAPEKMAAPADEHKLPLVPSPSSNGPATSGRGLG